MKASTKEMIRLTLSSDDTIAPALAQRVMEMLEGREQGRPIGERESLLMTMIAAAKLLGVSRVTMWRIVKEGVLRPVEITPRVFRIRREDLQELASRRTKYKPVNRGGPEAK